MNTWLSADEGPGEISFNAMEKNHIGNPKSIDQGRKKYSMNCVACHGPKGAGARAPTLITNGFVPNGVYDNKFFFNTIFNGRPGTIMGSFKEALSDEDIWYIIAYLRNESEKLFENKKP